MTTPAHRPDPAQASRLALALLAVGWGANQFTALLVVYRTRFGLSASTAGALFGCYALGLVPGLVLGGRASDARGRRAVVLPFLPLSVVATLLLMLGAAWLPALAAGRLVAGVVSGVAFGAGSAWLVELTPGLDARRAAVAVSAGFCLGPLVAGLVADVLPAPAVLPYVPHLLLAAWALPRVLRTPETRVPGTAVRRERPTVEVRRHFALAVAPVAPFVFATVAAAFVVLPGRFGPLPHLAALVGAMTGATLGLGTLLQPRARRLERRRRGAASLGGLACAALGFAAACWAAWRPSASAVVLVVALMGAAYAGCLVGGLEEVGRIATPATRGTLVGGFYAWAYVGFGGPFLTAWLARWAGVPAVLLGFGVAAVLASVAVVIGLARPGAAAAVAPRAG